MGVIEEYKGRAGFYDLAAANRAYINFLRKGSGGEENINYNTERALFMRAKRRDVEFDLGLKEGKLHTSEDVEAVLAGMLISFKSRLAAIPAKLSPVLSKKSDKAEISRILKAACDEALSELADFNSLFGEAENESGNAEVI
jgi:hypothetical protein